MLLFDLGNTRIKVARAEAGALQSVQAWPFADTACWDAVARFVTAAPEHADAVYASVTQVEREQRLQNLVRDSGRSLRRIGPPHSDRLLHLAYGNPASFGVDRWLALRALRRELNAPFVLASVGTALTVDTVDAQGRHLGGVIAPSAERAREALLQRATHLPAAPGQVDAFASNTVDAVHSGAVLAAAALIERIHSEAERRLDCAVELLLTGGGAAALAPWIHVPLRRCEHLVLRGLLDFAGSEHLPAAADAD